MARVGVALAILLLQGSSAAALKVVDSGAGAAAASGGPSEAQVCQHLLALARKVGGFPFDSDSQESKMLPSEAVEGPETPEGHHANNVDYVYPGEHPGCFVRMPTGCPKHYMKTHFWRHDVSAEMNITEADCKMRKHSWDSYCGTTDAKVMYVSEPTTEEDKKIKVLDKYPGVDSQDPGCFVRMPTGCPNHFQKTNLWRHDTLMEEKGSTDVECKARKKYWDEYCGTKDVKVVFVPVSSD